MKTRNITFVMLVAIFYTAVALFACKDDDNSNPGKNEVSIEGMAFKPSIITITVNTTVKWTNNDGVAHTVTSDNGSFDSGNIADNATFTHTFTTVGTYAYHCTIHPNMTGSVVVQQSTSNSNY